MICPKCKGKNAEDNNVCSHCGFKLKTICPRCKHPNTLGQPKCANCNLTLIRYCSKCKAPNFPQAKECRKCGAPLLKKKVEVKKEERPEPVIKKEPKPEVKPEVKPEPTPRSAPEPVSRKPLPETENKAQEQEENFGAELKREVTREEALKALTNILSKADKGYVISLCAPEGTGKSITLTNTAQALGEEKITWLSGTCEPVKQNVPFAFFKDVITNLFGLPIISLNDNEIKKSVKKILETTLELTDQSVLDNIYKIVLNEGGGQKESIHKNFADIQKSIQEIIIALNKKTKVVLIIDDFEYIDKASFDCIKYLMKKNFLDNKNFLIITHTPATNTAKLFPTEISLQRMVILMVKPLTTAELDSILLSMLNSQNVLPEELKSKIFRQAKGLPLYVEQALWYLFQQGAIIPEQQGLVFNEQFKNVDINPDLAGLFMQRVALVERTSPDALKTILYAALFGYKFIPKLVETAMEIKEEEMQQIMQLLINSGIFAVYDQYNFGFKHISMWKIIMERAFNDDIIKELSAKALAVSKNHPSIKSAQIIKLAEYAEDNKNLFEYYNNAVQESLNLGDTLSYTANQVKMIELITKTNSPEKEKVAAKLSITEQIGKVNYESNPTIAINYLKESIKKYHEQENKVKVIELTGYLSRSCELAGNYQGVLDCSEQALKLATEKEENPAEVMLINFSKLDSFFNLGRLEETIMTAENDVLPSLAAVISKNQILPGLSKDEIKDIEYQTELTLAKALVFQGNIKAEELLKKIQARAEKEKQAEFEIKALLNQALMLTIQGDLRSSEEILEKILQRDITSENSDQIQLEWLFVMTLWQMLDGNLEKARSICYSALPLSKECKDHNLFALLKLLNGFFYQHFQHINNAIAIYDEVAHYCSEHKMATGALFSWYLAAEAELQTGNPERAEEIAQNALDIAKKPNINNFMAAILLSRLVAEIKIVNGDFEGAQIYIETGIEIAEKNNLSYPLVHLYLTFGKIYHENAAVKEENKDESSNYAHRLYTKALSLAEKIDNHYLISRIEKEIHNLQTFCKLSGITLSAEA